ncbi:restriction endonuclease [Priestia endophytica]|uniref:restriction endonuclease n=1 Tax=Priestia endophytica TaxID=135735 RepID=UPI00124C9CFF|nr:restriction endonuclease [Priestia endophytica]KAB2489654.1 restriction endonuclease [Priestia endophytica]
MDNPIVAFTIFFLLIVCFYVIRFIYRWIGERIALKRLAQSGIPYIDQMDGFQFEFYLKSLFQELGYQAQVTPKSGDFGADLIMKGPQKIVIQAKRYGRKNRVGISAIQQVYGAQAYYKADKAWVVTNSLFTKRARALAKACNVQLFDRQALQELILEVNPTHTAEKVYQEVKLESRTCPTCGKVLVVRQGKKNQFFGCSSFPQCRHTEPINTK